MRDRQLASHGARLCAFVLLVASALAPTGCGWGYVSYFAPERGGARAVLHADPYMRPRPPAGAELAPGELAIGCTNVRKLMLLPIPWLRRGFRPDEVEIELAFLSETGSPRCRRSRSRARASS